MDKETVKNRLDELGMEQIDEVTRFVLQARYCGSTVHVHYRPCDDRVRVYKNSVYRCSCELGSLSDKLNQFFNTGDSHA